MGQRFEGRNLEEALQTAAAALGAERYQLTYHVVLEKRGFLGGTKRVVIEAEVNEAASAPVAAPAVTAISDPQIDDAPRREERPSGGGGGRGRGRRDGGGREAGGRGRGGRRAGGERGLRRDREEFFEDDPGLDAPPQGEQSEAAAAVSTWIDQVLRLAKLRMVARTEENETQIIVKLYGSDASKFTERNGELLDALQVLGNKALVGRSVQKDVELDCAEFKGRRVEELNEKARATADQVRRDKREQLLPAMTPIERRIIHLALQDDADVTTESRGDGFYKRVAIIPRPAGTPDSSPAES